jgi:hypothetical protein
MKTPTIIKDILTKEEFLRLQDHVKQLDKQGVGYSPEFNRYEFGGTNALNELHLKLLPIAKEFFEDDSIVPSFNFGAWYFGEASLEKHKDVAPCSFSIDVCVYQKTPWDLYVEGVPYTLSENEALLYYGETQRHWRESFPDPENNVVCNVFFFYIPQDHWFLTEPKENHEAIRRQNQIDRNMT